MNYGRPRSFAVLAKVVDLNGFSAAARSLGVPKAAVSRAVADLEKALGVRILERTTRRIALTGAGRLIYPSCKRVVMEVDAARDLIARLHAPAGGALRVAAEPTYGRALLAPLVPRFLERFPSVPLEVVLQPIEAQECWDVAIRAGLPEGSTLSHRLLGAPPAVLCATPAYLQQRGTPARPEDLRQHDLLTPGAGSAEFRLLLARGSQRAELRVAAKLTVSDPAVLHGACAAGLGVALLPEFLCRQGLGNRPAQACAAGLDAATGRGSVCGLCSHSRSGYARAEFRGFSGREYRAGTRARAPVWGILYASFIASRLDVSRTHSGASFRTR